MSEMSLTADHLIVIGRGRMIADLGVDEFVRRASKKAVRVRTPQATELRSCCGPGRDGTAGAGALEVSGLTAEQIGEAAAAHGIVLHELAPQQASLEEAFMELTRDDVEFQAAALAGGGGRMTSVAALTPVGGRRGVTQARVVRSEWTKLRSLRSTLWSLFAASCSGSACRACSLR